MPLVTTQLTDVNVTSGTFIGISPSGGITTEAGDTAITITGGLASVMGTLTSAFSTVYARGTGTDVIISLSGQIVSAGFSFQIPEGLGFYEMSGAINWRVTGGDLRNDGSIFGGEHAIELSTDSTTTTSRLVNFGRIIADGTGILARATHTEDVVIRNVGFIDTNGPAIDFSASAADVRLINRGQIQGDVNLGGGVDFIDNRRGVIDGRISGGSGNDTFVVGAEEESIDGGIGIDTLDFRGARPVSLSLFNGQPNEGRAEGDTYLNIENVVGGRADDRIFGNSLNNRLDGDFGSDSLRGESGNDVLVGRFGNDTLSGGAGDDQYHFAAASDGIDTITDFGAGAGNDDRLYFSAAGFGLSVAAGLLPSAMFRSATVNTAVGTADQFVLQTTDNTLWFDADGTGGAGPVQIARFTGGLPGAADFFVF